METRVHVFTFREGLLSRLAHDLRLSARSFELVFEQGRIEGWVDAASLAVDGVAHGERVDSEGLSGGDKRKIEAAIAREILDAAHYPRIDLHGRVLRAEGRLEVEGQLRVRGREQPIRIPLRGAPDRTIAEVELVPSRFGIPPYKALGGAIRLQDRVRVRVEIVAEPDKLDAISASGHRTVFRIG
jgi:hypothetical protein